MSRKAILIALVGCLLAGCALGTRQTWKNDYTLGPPHTSARIGAGAGAESPVAIRVATIEAPAWLSSRNMYYRLVYSEPGKTSTYSQSRWAAPPPEMLEDLLINELADSRTWRAVVSPETDARADYTLYLELVRFEQVFQTRRSSTGVVRARGTLVENRSGAVAAQRLFRFEIRAASADAAGGAAALNRASHELVGAVHEWLRQVTRHPATTGRFQGRRRPGSAQPACHARAA